jgi:hypothetical protein
MKKGQMKEKIHFLSTITLVAVVASGCVDTSDESLSDSASNAAITALMEDSQPSLGLWKKKPTIDEFGDTTMYFCYVANVSGTFSNSVTDKSELGGSISLQHTGAGFRMFFELLEYNKSPIRFLANNDVSMKVKSTSWTTSYRLVHRGQSPQLKGIMWLEPDDFDRFLSQSKDDVSVKCVITHMDSIYSLSIPMTGLQEAADDLAGKPKPTPVLPKAEESRNKTTEPAVKDLSATVLDVAIVSERNPKGKEVRFIKVRWKNTGTRPIRIIDGNIMINDNTGTLKPKFEYTIFARSNSEPAIMPGETYVHKEGGFALPAGCTAKEAKVEFTRVLEHDLSR